MDFATVLIIVGAGVLVMALMMALLWRCYHRVPAGKALIIQRPGRTDVTMHGGVVLPIVATAEEMDLRVKSIVIELAGRDAPHCRDGIRADMVLCFYVRVGSSADDVLAVARSVGAARASNDDTLRQLFVAKFSDAVSLVVVQLDFVDLDRQRDEVRDRILQVIGADLNGFVLDDVAIETVRMTPMDQLDPSNIKDAAGIRKIVAIATEEKLRQAELRREETMTLARHDLDARRAILEFERQRAEMEARQKYEIDVMQARFCIDTLRAIEEESVRLVEARGASNAEVSEAVNKADSRYRGAMEDLERLQADSEAKLRQLRTESEAKLATLKKQSEAKLHELATEQPPPKPT